MADFSLEEIPKAAVLIGANGSGKSNVLKFFEMLSWMVKPRQLGIFVGKNGGASDNLFGGGGGQCYSKTGSIHKAIDGRWPKRL